MSSARQYILAQVSAATADPTLPDDLEAAFSQLIETSSARIEHHKLRSFNHVVAEFDERTSEVNSEVIYCSDNRAVNQTLGELVGSQPVYIADDAMALADGLNSISEARGEAPYALMTAEAAIAETGTVVANSRIARSDALYLFDHLILVVQADTIVARFEDYWQCFRPADEFTRAIHMISGPSRTADVEQIIQLGAHGPRRLTVIIVGQQQ